MRVATRRLRAALEVFEPCFPRKRWRAALREVKQLADALGERRDRDVAIAALEAFNAEMPAPDRPGLDTLIERLRDEQDEANEALTPFVEPDRLAALDERLRGARCRGALDSAPPRPQPAPAGRRPGARPDAPGRASVRRRRTSSRPDDGGRPA